MTISQPQQQITQSTGSAGMSELLPCPFCGGTDVRLRHHHQGSMSWVSCVGCGLEAPSETGVTDEDAVAYWNNRAIPNPLNTKTRAAKETEA